MQKYKIYAACIVMLVFSAVSGLAQAPACPAGTMADVVGTSCSIGNLTFNFQNDFNASVFVFNQGNIDSRPISPAEIGFIPVVSGNQTGFQLVTNITEGPGFEGAFLSTHNINFSYTPQANPGFDILAETLSLDTSVQNPGPDSAITLAADDQCYSNGACTQVFPKLINQSGSPLILKPSDSVNLQVPSLLGTGSFAPGIIPTTTIQSVASGQAQAILNSATILYTVDAQIPVPTLAHVSYTNIDLPGEAGTFVSNINASGKMVGSLQDAAGVFHAYMTDEDGGFTVIDFPGATTTFGEGLNDRGDVVGAYRDTAGVTHGFLLQRGAFSTVDVPGATFSLPFDINNQGEITGLFRTPDHKSHGFLLTSDGVTVIDQGPPGLRGAEVLTEATGINNRSTVVGAFFDPDTFRSFELAGGISQHFDVPGQGDTFAEGINDRDDIVGSFDDINFVTHGFVLSNGEFRTVDFPGAALSFALGSNESGTIVGQYIDDAGVTHSFLAERRTDADNETRPDTRGRQRSAPVDSCSDPRWENHPELVRQGTRCSGGSD